MRKTFRLSIFLVACLASISAFAQSSALDTQLNQPLPSPLVVVTANQEPFSEKIIVDLKIANTPEQMPLVDTYVVLKQVPKRNSLEGDTPPVDREYKTFYSTVNIARLMQTGDLYQAIETTEDATPFVAGADFSRTVEDSGLFMLQGLPIDVPYDESIDYVVYFILLDPQNDQLLGQDMDYTLVFRPQGPPVGDMGPCDFNQDGTVDEGEAQECENQQMGDTGDNGNGKVTICHNGHTITISESALDAHLNHGDTMGACGQGEPGDIVEPCDFNRDGVVDDGEAQACENSNPDPMGGEFEPCDFNQDGVVDEWEGQTCENQDMGDPTVNEGDNGNGKVTICHNGHTITISESALDAHLNHGDTMGACGQGEPGDIVEPCDFNRDGVVDDGEAQACENSNPDPMGGEFEPCDFNQDGVVDEWEGQTCGNQDMGDPAGNEGNNGNGKVTICHDGNTITISESALDAHLNHGDTMGACGQEEPGVNIEPCDLNQDGMVDDLERQECENNTPPIWETPGHLDGNFQPCDFNHDGVVDDGEAQECDNNFQNNGDTPPDPMGGEFEPCDSNHDGVVDESESQVCGNQDMGNQDMGNQDMGNQDPGNQDMGNPTGNEGDYANGKVTICHKGRITIRINEMALDAHLNHGDQIGACEDN